MRIQFIAAVALAASAMLAGCGDSGAADHSAKVAEQFKKQFSATCSMELMNAGLQPGQKDQICSCAGDKLLADTQLPGEGDGFQQIRLTKDTIVPAINACAAEAGAALRLTQ